MPNQSRNLMYPPHIATRGDRRLNIGRRRRRNDNRCGGFDAASAVVDHSGVLLNGDIFELLLALELHPNSVGSRRDIYECKEERMCTCIGRAVRKSDLAGLTDNGAIEHCADKQGFIQFSFRHRSELYNEASVRRA